MSIEKMRRTYTMAGLGKKDVDPDPMVQFQRWFDESQDAELPDWVEVNAMTLSTTNLQGQVTSRIVLLKGIEGGKFVFFTNYESTKGHQLAANPRASLCFYWPHLQRQVRIEGVVSKTNRERSVLYFHSRPRESQLGANVSEQSTTIDSENLLTTRMEQLVAQYADGQVPCPEHWGGYEVTPTAIEFWQGRPSRLHDRICYRREDQQWAISRLAP